MGSKDNPVTALGGVVVGGNPALLPSGAMHLASRNVVCREPEVVESRRGLQRVALSERFDKLFGFSDLLFGHQLDVTGGALFRFNPAFTLATSLGVLTSPATRRPQSVAAGGRLFFTTASDGGVSAPGTTGLKVLDSTSDVLVPAGGPVAPGCVLNAGVVGGWLTSGNQVAYRYTLGRVTATGLQIVGPPSGRQIEGATGGGTWSLTMAFRLPPGLDDSYFIQVWRSSQVLTPAEPDDDLRLVYERNLNASECTNLVCLITDVVPDELRGEFLYTNPNSGEGIQQANHPPPLAEEIALHKDRLWLGRTTQPYEFNFKIIAIGGAGGMANLDRIIITSQSPALELTAGTDFTVSTGGSASQNIMDTARSLVRGINAFASNTSVFAEYTSGPDSSIGEIRVYERKVNSAGPFQMFVDQRSGGAAWTMRSAFAPEFLPYLPGIGTAITFSLQRVANVVTATISSGNLTNALRAGDRVGIGNPAGTFGAGPHTVTGVTATTFTYAETAVNAGPTAGFVFSITTDNIATASREEAINRVHFSKAFEYEAFPRGDYADIGASDKGIIAMRVTRETLWVFKEDGLFRITGDDPATFDVERVDATLVAITPECVQPFAEALVAWTTKGVVMISESSFDIISGDISSLLRGYLEKDATLGTSLLSQCYFVVDEKDALLRLHLAGSSRDDAATVVGAGEAMVYSAITKTWHHWSFPGALGPPKPLTHGVVNPFDRRVYYVDAYASAGEGFLWRDRTATESKRYADDIETDDGLGDPNRVAIARVALWVAQFDKAPMRDKRWDEVTILFGKPVAEGGEISQPGTFLYGFGNENQEANDDDVFFGMATTFFVAIGIQSETPVGPAVRILVPVDFTRGQRLWVGVSNAEIDVPFTIHGFSLLAEVLNSAISR